MFQLSKARAQKVEGGMSFFFLEPGRTARHVSDFVCTVRIGSKKRGYSLDSFR